MLSVAEVPVERMSSATEIVVAKCSGREEHRALAVAACLRAMERAVVVADVDVGAWLHRSTPAWRRRTRIRRRRTRRRRGTSGGHILVQRDRFRWIADDDADRIAAHSAERVRWVLERARSTV